MALALRSMAITALTLTVQETKVALLTRCHKQLLVNLNRIDGIIRQEIAPLSKTKSGKLVSVSRRFLGQLKERC